MQYKSVFSTLFVLSALFFIAACQEDDTDFDKSFSFDYDFEEGTEGWTALFADYPVGKEEDMGLSFKHTTLPAGLPQNKKALEISGNNTSDDLLMLLTRKITGLKPNATYDISFDIDLASKYPESAPGAGGSPGASVVVKIGAIQEEPGTVEDDQEHERPNWDNLTELVKGERTDDVVVIGNIGIAGDEEVYTMINLHNDETGLSFSKKSSSKGELWVMVGTDSGFEGLTTLYYDAIHIVFTEK